MTDDPYDYITEAITAHWGERCPDYEPQCACCAAWAQYDALKACEANSSPSTAEALRVLTDAVGRYLDLGAFKSVRADLAKGLKMGTLALDPDLGNIKPGHICKHGVRWPHACDECDAAALDLRRNGRPDDPT